MNEIVLITVRNQSVPENRSVVFDLSKCVGEKELTLKKEIFESSQDDIYEPSEDMMDFLCGVDYSQWLRLNVYPSMKVNGTFTIGPTVYM